MNTRINMTPDVAFFFAHGAYSYDPTRQTEAEGRLACAEASALAEARGRRAGLSFAWEVDPDVTSAEWREVDEDGGRDCDPWRTWCCRCYAPGEGNQAGEILMVEALGGIDFGRDGSPYGDPYRRVVEAQLTVEALSWVAAVEAESGPAWTDDDQEAARGEGWGIYGGAGHAEVQQVNRRLADDAAACRHVAAGACPLHARALAYVKALNPAAYWRMTEPEQVAA